MDRRILGITPTEMVSDANKIIFDSVETIFFSGNIFFLQQDFFLLQENILMPRKEFSGEEKRWSVTISGKKIFFENIFVSEGVKQM